MWIYRYRPTYWSSSKIAKKVHRMLGAPDVPYAETMEGWNNWDNHVKENYPFAYWLHEHFWNGLQDIVYFPKDLYRHFYAKYKNRFVDKVWMLDTGLDRTEWRDYDTRLLHAVFNSFCEDFCIREKGHGSIEKLYERWSWEISLKYDEDWIDPEDEKFGQPTQQALCAMKERELFEWWRNERPIEAKEAEDSWTLDKEDKLCEKDDEKLKELIDIRRGLWT